MAEYIEREALIANIVGVVAHLDGDSHWIEGYRDGLQAVGKLVKKLPAADVVEVVRCKDCKRFVDNKEAFVTYCRRELKDCTVRPDDFCSYGERRTEDDL